MTKMYSTKRSLLTSVIALMLCFAMLLGTTFAWFTDSVTSANNIIKSGTLDVTMEWFEGEEAVPAIESTDWKDASKGAIFNYDLWEPGFVQTRHIKIENEGTLALKYKVLIMPTGEVSDLADVIDVYYTDPAAQITDRSLLTADKKIGTLTEVIAKLGETGYGELAAGESHTLTLALKMQESAGNEYQNKAIGSDFEVKLLATQLTAEDDSFDDQYDKDAKYDAVTTKVATATELENAITEGNPVVLSKDIELNQPIELAPTSKAIIDLGGFTLTNAQGTAIEVTSGEVEITNGTIKNGMDNVTARSVANGNTAIALSGDVVAKITGVTIDTTGTGIALSGNATITELNANVNTYLNVAQSSWDFSAVNVAGSARIDEISGGKYTCSFANEIVDPYPSSFSHSPSFAIKVDGAGASIGEISGGTFLGYCYSMNGATVYVSQGKIEKISNGYFGFYKKTARNDPYVLLEVINDGSIGSITGGTFEPGKPAYNNAKRFNCDFEGIVAASGKQIVPRAETVTVNVKYSSFERDVVVEVWDVK